MPRDPEKRAARRARRKTRKNPLNLNSCPFLSGDGTPACSASSSNKSSAPKNKKNKFGRGVKSGNKLKGGKALAKQKEKDANKKARNATPNPNQKHATPRNLGGPF